MIHDKIGGATGSIGDPSGRSTERVAMELAAVEGNADMISGQISKVFENAHMYLKRRVEADPKRFSHLLQAYDFYHLWKTENCSVQLGGSDQWGNITAGIDLIRKKGNIAQKVEKTVKKDSPSKLSADRAFGLTVPLLTNSTGEKFGKSAGNAVWMDAAKLSFFDFYQFFRRTPDADVERYLKYFTFLSLEEIDSIMSRHKLSPQNHEPQRKLAFEVTELVHGLASASRAETMSQVLFDSDVQSLSAAEIIDAFHGDERLVELKYEDVVGVKVQDVVFAAKGTASKSAARKMLAAGGIYLNNKQVLQDIATIQKSDMKDDCLCLLRIGKNQYRIVKANK
ncbi:tyrosyl-tRNA synthetase [Dinochytrium kinnereticum]|nr:tyrosyl-tRNA synthetase [Dinochytrium kinnereticum]